MTDVITPLLRGSGLKRRGGLLGDCLAEFLGTAVLIMFGDGVVAMAVAALPGSGRAETPTTIFLAAGDWLLITWGWALAVVFGVYVAGGVSGAHLNPAVTLAFAVRRKFPWPKVVPYWISQVVGAFVGAAIVYWVYHDAIRVFDAASTGPKVNGHTLATYSIFATFPSPVFDGSSWGPLLDQIVGTALLLLCIAAVIDLRNTAVQANLGPYIIGMSVAASACRSARMPAMRSTRHVISAPGSSPGSPGGTSWRCPAHWKGRSATTSGYRSSVRSSAA